MIAHLRGRDRKLELHGWTGQEAEWIALVCDESGCTPVEVINGE